MDDKNTGYKTHLFICTNSPDREGKCGSKGAEDLRRTLKERCGSQFGKKEVRINSSGCLGHCERGIAAVLYSNKQSQWFLDLTGQDDDLLYEAVKKSQTET